MDRTPLTELAFYAVLVVLLVLSSLLFLGLALLYPQAYA
jgi:hypothetical protein